MDAVGRAQSLDEVIDAQNRFLHDVILGTLLGNEAGAKVLPNVPHCWNEGGCTHLLHIESALTMRGPTGPV